MPAQSPINYYDILGVSRDAASDEIRAAYRARIAHYHPDRSRATHAGAIAALLNEAWEVLGNRDRRRLYDAGLGAGGALAPRPAHDRGGAGRPVRGRPAESNRRVLSRVKTLVTAHVIGSADADVFTAECTCLDLSPDGTAFTLGRFLAVGSPVTMQLDLSGRAVIADARVVRCDAVNRRGRWKIAVTFDGLDQRARLRVIEFVQAERSRRLD